MTEQRRAAAGFIAVFFLRGTIVLAPENALRAITQARNGDSHGHIIAAFFITAHRLTRRGVHGQSAKNICGGMKRRKDGPAPILLTLSLTSHLLIVLVMAQQECRRLQAMLLSS